MIRRAARAQIKTLASDKRARGGSSGRTCASRTLKSSIPTWTGVGLSSGTCSRMQVQYVGVGVESRPRRKVSKPEGARSSQCARDRLRIACQIHTHTHTQKVTMRPHDSPRGAHDRRGHCTGECERCDGPFQPTTHNPPTIPQREEPTSGRQGSRGKRPLNCCRPTLCL